MKHAVLLVVLFVVLLAIVLFFVPPSVGGANASLPGPVCTWLSTC